MNNYKYVKEIGRGNYGQALLCIHNLDSQKVHIIFICFCDLKGFSS